MSGTAVKTYSHGRLWKWLKPVVLGITVFDIIMVICTMKWWGV